NVDAGQTITVVAEPVLRLYGGNGNAGINTGSLVTLNQATAAGTFIADTIEPGGLTGLAYDAATDPFLGSTIRYPSGQASSVLVRIDPNTGALLSAIGAITAGPGGPAISIGDLAIQPGTGILYGVRSNAGGGGGLLYTIDKTTGVATFVGNTGL